MRGFTLIEILVAASLVMIFSGLGIASYNNFNQRQLLKQSAEEVKNALRDAQNRALIGEKNCLCQVGPVCGDNDDKSLDYWKFRILDFTTYEIRGRCGGDTDFDYKSFSLPRRLYFKSAMVSLEFKPFVYGVIPVVGDNKITIENWAIGKNITITIESGGEIKVGEITDIEP